MTTGQPAGAMYADYLNDMASRIDAAYVFLDVRDWSHIRAGGAELRSVLEMLLLAGLITHREMFDKVESQLRGLNRKDARRMARGVNPNWWPQPVVNRPSPIEGVKGDIVDREEDDWLTESRWDAAHTFISDHVLHVSNPYAARPRDLERDRGKLIAIAHQMVALLTSHIIQLGDEFWLAQIDMPNVVPRVHVVLFTSAPE